MRFMQFLLQWTPPKPILVLGMALMIAESAAALASPWFAGQLAQFTLQGESLLGESLLVLIGMWVVLISVQTALRIANHYVLTRSGAKLLARMTNRIYQHLQYLPLGFHAERKRGELLSLLTHDVTVLSHFVTGTLVGIVPMLFILIGALLLMASIDPLLAGLAAAMLPGFYFVIKFLGLRIRPVAQALSEQQAQSIALAEEHLAQLPLIKAYAQETQHQRKFHTQTAKVTALRKTQLRHHALLAPLVQWLASIGVLGLLWLSTVRLTQGVLSAPQLVSFLFYGFLLTRPISAIANLYGQLQQARGSAARIMALFDEEPEPVMHGASELPRMSGAIEFRDLSFAYPGRAPLLQGLNLHIAAGETIAITGANGAGKSTLVQLLLRFVEPHTGAIYLDGIALQDLQLNALRRQFGLVSQKVFMANTSIAQNIAFGKPEASLAQIQAVACAAHAHEFIAALPQGYDTLVGEQGLRLSGGQCQRIALARALLVDPPVLLLDEATAMFDPNGERELLRTCREAFRTRTVIIITHRSASLALADRVVQLQHGKIIEYDQQVCQA